MRGARDHDVKAAALVGDLLGLLRRDRGAAARGPVARAAARSAAPERPRLPSAALAGQSARAGRSSAGVPGPPATPTGASAPSAPPSPAQLFVRLGVGCRCRRLRISWRPRREPGARGTASCRSRRAAGRRRRRSRRGRSGCARQAAAGRWRSPPLRTLSEVMVEIAPAGPRAYTRELLRPARTHGLTCRS